MLPPLSIEMQPGLTLVQAFQECCLTAALLTLPHTRFEFDSKDWALEAIAFPSGHGMARHRSNGRVACWWIRDRLHWEPDGWISPDECAAPALQHA